MNESRPLASKPGTASFGGNATAWQPGEFANPTCLPLICAEDARPILPDFDLWDCWPLQHEDGRTAEIGRDRYWFFLSAPRFPDPGRRHLAAKIRMLRLTGDKWHDCGPALPDGCSIGHAQWAGSAVLHQDGKTVSLFYTASGSTDGPGFQQRMAVATGLLGPNGPGGWSPSRELVVADGQQYVRVDSADGEPGRIKAFRDPAWFRDPHTSKTHILFTGSAAWTSDEFNGLIGLATLIDGAWRLDRPLVTAIGVNNELERPHIIMREGRYYLFWSTQRFVFSPRAQAGPNGLYAMVADRLDGAWRPVNDNGLVIANPSNEPVQSYSWWVTGEGVVWSFIDHWGMAGRSFEDHPELLRQQFGGTPAPLFELNFAGDRVTLMR